jgi:hypothetical protein
VVRGLSRFPEEMKMKHPITTVLLAVGAVLLGSCEREPDPASRINSRLVERFAAEREARQRSEAELQQEKNEKSGWQIAASILFGGAILALIIGTILGSRARHDATK